jgi:hypothetical protein
MSSRFLYAFLAFVFVVGPGALWLLYRISKKKELLKNLLSLPKERRFFWYKLRKAGFEVLSQNMVKDFSVSIDGNPQDYSIRIDFLLKKKGKRYAGLFTGQQNDKELLRPFFLFYSVFRVKGVIFYNEEFRNFQVWEF